MKKIRMLILFPKYMKGKHGNMPEVSFYKAKKIVFRSADNVALNADGEVSWVKEAVYEIMPQGIELVFPKLG